MSYSPRWQRRITVPSHRDPDDIAAAAGRYIDFMIARGHTDQTVFNCDRYLYAFLQWCRIQCVQSVPQADTAVLERYLAYVQSLRTKAEGRPLAWCSREAMLIPVRTFFRWLTKTRRLPRNPAEDLLMVRRPYRLPVDPLTPEQVQAVLARPKTWLASGIRDRAILEVLFATGIRRMELIQLRIDDVDCSRRMLTVRNGKGGKRRVVPMSPSCVHWVTAHLERQAKRQPASVLLFPCRLKTAFNPTHLSTHVGNYIRKATGRAGACHLLRHSMATIMLDNGVDSRFIQELLGHSELSTTQVYTHVRFPKLLDVYDRGLPTITDPALRRQPDPGPIFASKNYSWAAVAAASIRG